MFKEIYNATSADTLSAMATLIFVGVFLSVLVWALTRGRRTVDRWARIPLEDEPVEPGSVADAPLPAADDQAVCGLPFARSDSASAGPSPRASAPEGGN